jgi:hypothetical protein
MSGCQRFVSPDLSLFVSRPNFLTRCLMREPPDVFARVAEAKIRSRSHAASGIREPFQCRPKTQAAGSHQCGAEHFSLVAGERPRKSAGDFAPAEQRANERIGKRRVLIGAQVTLPRSARDGVAAGRPEIGPAPPGTRRRAGSARRCRGPLRRRACRCEQNKARSSLQTPLPHLQAGMIPAAADRVEKGERRAGPPRRRNNPEKIR